ncbi:LysR substrate-binding domain-containing protein [Brevibacillus parabrevis]|uniref:LysR substrate-binding domain-containing protein n=1 Tax=Brevibacillus parabrevis TaxID=54914 RepID=UPI0036F3C58F
MKLFKQKYPLVEFKVETGWSKDVCQAVYNQDVHLGFVRGDYNWPGGKQLLFEESVCIVSQTPLDLNSLPDLPRIDYETDPLYATDGFSSFLLMRSSLPEQGVQTPRGRSWGKRHRNEAAATLEKTA